MDETHRRVQQFQDLMEREGVDLAVIGPTTNLRYLLGIAPHPDERLCLLLVTPKQLQLIVPKLNVEGVSLFTDVEILSWDDAAGPDGVLRGSLLQKVKIGKLAIDGLMRADFLLGVLSLRRPEEIVPLEPLLSLLRMRKSPYEIDLLQSAAEQADRVMAAVVDACRPGITEQEVAWEAESTFRRDGAEEVSFTLIAAGSNAAYPHHTSGQKEMQRGEGIIIDIGASLGSYKSDITRVVHLGKPSAQFLQVYDTVLRANELGRRTVKPNVPAGEVDRATRVVVEESGYGAFFIHRTGHGIGLDVHEPPWIMRDSDMALEEGMVFSIEPGIYLPGRFGVRVEDIVVVTDSGSRVLTGFRHELVIK